MGVAVQGTHIAWPVFPIRQLVLPALDRYERQPRHVDLFNRNLVAFREDDRITLVSLQELKEKFRNGILKADALTFNNLVSTKAEFENGWIAPAAKTWLSRYIPNELANVK